MDMMMNILHNHGSRVLLENYIVKLNVNTQEIIWEQEYPQIYGGRHYMNDIISSNDDGFVICGNLGHLCTGRFLDQPCPVLIFRI